MSARIRIEHLRKVYVKDGKQLPVLRGIDVEIAPGEMVSIAGASGAGKSTFLHVLGTLDHPSSGRVLFDSLDVFKMKQARIAAFRNESIGFVFQFHHLLPEFSALENVAMPAMIARKSRAQAEAMARELLVRVGLEQRLTHKPGELSGGEQQRVALARALVMKPKLLLADEPTGNLDVGTSDGIHALFRELNQDMGITIIVVTHNPILAAMMPRQLCMDAGLLEDVTADA